MTATSKIKIKLGPIEIEYEGSEVFLKEELPELLAAVSELYAKSHAGMSVLAAQATQSPAATNDLVKPLIEATTGSIAAKLSVKSGPELILAAAARLTLVAGTAKFSRQNITDEMKTATAYYRSTYMGNLTASLNGLVKDGKLNEPSLGNYALSAATLKDLEQRIV